MADSTDVFFKEEPAGDVEYFVSPVYSQSISWQKGRRIAHGMGGTPTMVQVWRTNASGTARIDMTDHYRGNGTDGGTVSGWVGCDATYIYVNIPDKNLNSGGGSAVQNFRGAVGSYVQFTAIKVNN